MNNNNRDSREVSFADAIASGCKIGYSNPLDGEDGEVVFIDAEELVGILGNTLTPSGLVATMREDSFLILL